MLPPIGKKKMWTPQSTPGKSPHGQRGFNAQTPKTGGEAIVSPPPFLDGDALHAALTVRAPSWALCGDAPHEAAREESRRPAEYALAQRFCQLNPRGRLGNIVLDLDHLHGLNLLDAPPPTYTTLNLESGHQQPGYLLAQPVARGKQAQQGPQRYADDVRRLLTRELGGDPAFSGLISRGPLHPGHVTRPVSGRVYTLGELLRSLPPMPGVSRRAANAAAEDADREGRNCAAFEALRFVAYGLHDQGVTGAALVRQVQHQADELNRSTFGQHAVGPLPARELAGIVRSICKWTDAHHRPSKASARSRTHSRERKQLTETQQAARIREGQAKGAMSRREATIARLRAAELELQAGGQLVTAAALVTLTGVGRTWVLRYLRNASQTAETG